MILVKIETTETNSDTTFEQLTYYVNWDLIDYREGRLTDKDILSDFSGIDYTDEEIETLGFIDGPFKYEVSNVLQMSFEEYEVLCGLGILYDYRELGEEEK
jgi:hypothetical protein